MDTFVQSQVKLRNILPPMRFLFVGDDKKFSKFLQNYLGLLGIFSSDDAKPEDAGLEKPTV